MAIIRALIFDFDGLILDTEAPEYQSWQEIYREHGCDVPLSLWASFIGTSRVAHTAGCVRDTMPGAFNAYDYLEAQAGRPIDRHAIRAKRKQRDFELIVAQPIMLGVQTYLEDAKRLGMKMGVASNSSPDWVDGHLARLGLRDYFACVECANNGVPAKPVT